MRGCARDYIKVIRCLKATKAHGCLGTLVLHTFSHKYNVPIRVQHTAKGAVCIYKQISRV